MGFTDRLIIDHDVLGLVSRDYIWGMDIEKDVSATECDESTTTFLLMDPCVMMHEGNGCYAL